MKDGLYTFDEIKENKEYFASIFSEGNKELEKVLIKLWNNNISTIACCGHKTTIMGKSKHGNYFTPFEKTAYIAIDTTNMKKGVTFKNMAGTICHGKNLVYEVDERNGQFSRNALTLYQEGINTDKFFRKINEMLDVFLEKENEVKIDTNKINLSEYDLKNTISNKMITNDNPTGKCEFMHDGHKYEMLNFDFANTRHSFALFDTQTNPKQIVGYAVYDFNKNTKSLALQSFVIKENMRGNKLGRMFLKSFDKMIEKCFDTKLKDMYVHPYTDSAHQATLEDFYQQAGFKLTNGDPAEYIFNPQNYTRYKSEFNDAIKNIEKNIGKKENGLDKYIEDILKENSEIDK